MNLPGPIMSSTLSGTPSLSLSATASPMMLAQRRHSSLIDMNSFKVMLYFLVVKSVSKLEEPLFSLRPQVQASRTKLAQCRTSRI